MKRLQLVLALGALVPFAVSATGCGDSAESAGGDYHAAYDYGSGDTGSGGGDEGGEYASGAPASQSSGGAAADEYWEPEVPEPSVDNPAEDDAYESVGTNPFVMVAHRPSSSFSADVDTASYDIFRRDINQYNALPQPEGVRLEEYVNAFNYGVPAPGWEAEEPFAVELEAAPSTYTETTVFRIGIQGKALPSDWHPPTNLVFLVDVSGSMSSSNKLPLVKVLLAEVASKLDESDRISIVTYANGEAVALPPTGGGDQETIQAAIDGLSAGGATAGQKGMAMAYEQAEAVFNPEGANHVLLCTDGDFNVGISDTDELVHFIETKREGGVTLTAVGFGSGNLNDEMMEKVTNAGNGVYAVISDADQAIAYANDQIWSSIYHIAQDVKLQVVFNPEQVVAYRLLGYENRILTAEEFEDDTTDAGELGAGHSVTALYELVRVGADIPEAPGAPVVVDGDDHGTDDLDVDPAEIAHLAIRYKMPGAAADDPSIEVTHRLMPADLTDAAGDATGDLLWASSIAAFAEILKDSPYAVPAALDTIAATVQAHAGTAGDRLEFLSLFETARGLLAE